MEFKEQPNIIPKYKVLLNPYRKVGSIPSLVGFVTMNRVVAFDTLKRLGGNLRIRSKCLRTLNKETQLS